MEVRASKKSKKIGTAAKEDTWGPQAFPGRETGALPLVLAEG